MKLKAFILLLIVLPVTVISAQKKEDYKPYTIQSTYNKLKKKYPNVSPIQPLISNKIKLKENRVYKKVNQTKLKLDLYLPKSNIKNQRFPLVFLIHGGGWLTGQKENQRVMAQHLALHGYIAVTASYRLGLEAPYPAAVIDLKDALVWLRQHAKKYKIHTGQISVLGTSAGGQLATLIGVTPNTKLYEPDRFVSEDVQAIINIDGIVSFIHPEAHQEGAMASIWLNGTRESNWKNWKEASPLEYVNENAPPMLFINSSQDRFHAGRDDLISILKNHDIYNEVHTLEDSPHSFWLLHPWFEPTLKITVNFLNKLFYPYKKEMKIE
ncbi:alpha/beta hydrolase [Aestuariivivens sediminicola]|uniref:alpha/beta hydrolase n=1 Tax=Aestuariivivens sediminicola TaxID=2913560 RepID=UPI001F56FE9F|nr:alpha/beta hydrolase [Aestuariivivens sediminicola]